MTDPQWMANEGHPSLELLLLHVEGELESREASALNAHVKDCWTCRASCDRLRQGIFNFMEFYAGAELPAHSTNQYQLKRRLQQEARESRADNTPAVLFGSMDVLRRRYSTPTWIGLGLFCAAAILFLIRSMAPLPSVSAAEFLEHARQSSRILQSASPGKVIYKKVQIRCGNTVLQRSLYQGKMAPIANVSVPEQITAEALAEAHVNWEDPLNAEDFASWHDSQSKKRDKVTEEKDDTTLTTTVSGDAWVRQASLTLANSDGRPIARRVEYWNEPSLEVTEIAYEVRNAPVEPVASDRNLAAREMHMAKPGPSLVLAKPVSESDLDESELRLRESFHALGADVANAPEIWRADKQIRFRVFPESPDRKEEILHAVENIPYVMETDATASFSPQSPLEGRRDQLTTPYATSPPLGDALRERFGGQDEANQYLGAVQNNYDDLLAESAALKRLAKRYPAKTFGDLPEDMQARIARIADDYNARIRAIANQYLELVSPVLDDMGRRQSISTASTPDVRSSSNCLAWQERPDLITKALVELEQNFTRLFVQEQVSQPMELSVTGLLTQSSQARRQLQLSVVGFCPAQQ